MKGKLSAVLISLLGVMSLSSCITFYKEEKVVPKYNSSSCIHKLPSDFNNLYNCERV